MKIIATKNSLIHQTIISYKKQLFEQTEMSIVSESFWDILFRPFKHCNQDEKIPSTVKLKISKIYIKTFGPPSLNFVNMVKKAVDYFPETSQYSK